MKYNVIMECMIQRTVALLVFSELLCFFCIEFFSKLYCNYLGNVCLWAVSHITEVAVFRVVSFFAWALITAVTVLRGERNGKLLDPGQIQSKTG